MESTRQQKIAKVIQKDLSTLFLRYTKEKNGVLVSVSEVRVSPDLSLAHVFLSIFPSDRSEEMYHFISEEQAKKIRGELGQLERHQLRIIPQLVFHIDETLDRLEKIGELIQQ
ncbi:MAG: 30S ribosome-binding factor RbfA [Paludibacteraceae bacterium]|jgi:ribosome-binding factor A|nr:30S ribosome-binding factor RbfA [Paludibacteraceae bacterium]